MEDLWKILGFVGALLLSWTVVYLRGRARGKDSVPRPEEVRAEERETILEEGRERRTKEREHELEQIRATTEARIEEGTPSLEDAQRLLDEADKWPHD